MLIASTYPFACLGVLCILSGNTNHYSERQHPGKIQPGLSKVSHFCDVCICPVEFSLLPVFVNKVLLAHKARPLIRVLSVSVPRLQQQN